MKRLDVLHIVNDHILEALDIVLPDTNTNYHTESDFINWEKFVTLQVNDNMEDMVMIYERIIQIRGKIKATRLLKGDN